MQEPILKQKKNKTVPNAWGTNNYMHMRRSQDFVAYSGQSSYTQQNPMNNYGSARGSPRRNLKTAHRPEVGEMRLQDGLLMKDICYPNGVEQHQSLKVGGRVGGKSTDATAFRRSLIFNNGVLKERESSSPDICRNNTVPV